MIELPEAIVLGEQAKAVLTGKTITEVYTPTNKHKFAFFNGEPTTYKELLTNKKILSAKGNGIFVDIFLDDDTTISFGDGVNIRYGDASSKIPDKYQLLLTFGDNSFLVFTIGMYGAIFAYKGILDNKYHRMSVEKISPLAKEFNEAYFNNLITSEKKDITAKALLATEQRIPGLGNGVLQDILFKAKIHPKRKISTLTDTDKSKLFEALKNTLSEMTRLGGRDTEKDLSGNKGQYQTILSKNTYKDPCPVCGGNIVKEAYLGGTIYYCPNCQKL